MQKIWISVGQSRLEKGWKNIEVKWSWLVDKLSRTTRTNETVAEYLAMKPQEQDKIKDVGGFVGGIIQGGRRKAKSVVSRQLITLDLDKVSSDFYDDFVMLWPCASCMYTTHKHTPESPRMRIVVPLDREVQPDEYEAISRKVAELCDIDLFDPTTFQPERLMYWPSTPKDGEFRFGQEDGQWLRADDVLRLYSDWTDVSQWAYHSKINQKIKRLGQRQGNPLDKPGVIGVFNRTYDIRSAIETFLSDVYEKAQVGSDGDDRYTYVEGSTSAGVVIYEDLFSYSHHSTDPTCGRLCNAFDLVRIHKFGELDAGKELDGDTPGNKLPSYIKMIEFASNDKETKKNLIGDQMREMSSEFKVEGEKQMVVGEDGEMIEETVDVDANANANANGTGTETEEDMEWLKKLEVDKKGNLYNTINNCVLVLQNDKRLKDVFAFNEFDKRVVLTRSLPWRKVGRLNAIPTDADDSAIRNYFERVYKLTNSSKIDDAISIVAHKRGFHPVKSYLKGLVWDRVDRVEEILVRYLGAEESVYVREVTKKAMTAAVARVFEPGVKFDNVLTLVGDEGLGKSELIKRLAMEWFSDTFGSLQNNSAMEQLQGVWIMEIGELSGLKKAESETIKLFLSKREDRFRVAYGKRVESYPRECVFWASTNEDEFLQNYSGDRRFWPVKVGILSEKWDGLETPWDLEDSDVEQIWAEAKWLYEMGEDLFIAGEAEKLAKEARLHHFQTDERAGLIEEYVNMLVPENWYELDLYQRKAFITGDETVGKGVYKRTKISIPEIWCERMGNHIKDMSHYNTKYIKNIMSKLKDWKADIIKTKDYGTQRGYRHKDAKTSKIFL